MFSLTSKRFASAFNYKRAFVPLLSNSRLFSGAFGDPDKWIEEQLALLKPSNVHFCDGSQEESDKLIAQMIAGGTIKPISRPNSYLANSDPNDVARVEKQTYICSEKKSDAGPNNNWVEPSAMRETLRELFDGSMKGRTAYIMPFSMGPPSSPFSKFGLQITDSPFVVANTRIMTRLGKAAGVEIKKGDTFVPCLHSLGAPLEPGQKDVPWPCNKTKKIVHFPETSEIISYGSGYGGNALLGKKCFALRIASTLARKEGWLAEHMLILGITNPEGVKKYVAAAFPSACGKTNLAMLQPTIPGWKVETVGDDIAWLRFGADGRMYAINPENGFFGVAPGTSKNSNPNAMGSLEENVLFTNVAYDPKKDDIWWEGMSSPPDTLIDWKGNKWHPGSKTPAAHPNSRFTVPISQCPVVDSRWEDPQGVPISAIMFGGRRGSVVPLVYEAFDWEHGTYLGAAMASEQTAAAEGTVGNLRFDPMAMKPFCGYNMGDYFNHWLTVGKNAPDKSKLPSIFFVNWFRKGNDKKFLWPGFGENSRILKWIFNQTEGAKASVETAIGKVPKQGSVDVSGLDISPDALKAAFKINNNEWLEEVARARKEMSKFGDSLPKGIIKQMDKLEQRLKA